MKVMIDLCMPLFFLILGLLGIALVYFAGCHWYEIKSAWREKLDQLKNG